VYYIGRTFFALNCMDKYYILPMSVGDCHFLPMNTVGGVFVTLAYDALAEVVIC
jgi:hypothetical protein